MLELGSRIGCAVAGSLLAQLGCEVIGIESDACIGTGHGRANGSGKGGGREPLMAGKRSLAADLSADADRRWIEELAARSDVLLISSDRDPPLDLEFGARRRIVCDITAFGASGPRRGEAMTDLELQAFSALVDVTGLPEHAPTPMVGAPLEHIGGVHGAAGIVAALAARRRDGTGQAVEVALFDCAVAAIGTFLPKLLDSPEAEVRRVGNRHPLVSPWNVYEARDGWVLVCTASEILWRRLCDVIGRGDLSSDERFATMTGRVRNADALDEQIQAWVGGLTIAACMEKLAPAGIPCGPIAPVEGWPREANLDHRDMLVELSSPETGAPVRLPGSPIQASRTPGRRPSSIPAVDEGRAMLERLLTDPPFPSADDDGSVVPGAAPLAGVRVLELGHYTTAPLSARYLANLGAEVIKIEPPGGEDMRGWSPRQHGICTFLAFNNAGKRSLALDLTDPAGADVLRRLVPTADVLLENLKPGALARRGFGPDELARMNPRLVYCAISGFGIDTVYTGRPAYDTVIQAMSGMMDLTRSGGVPVKAGISAADLYGAHLAVLIILAALEHRADSGQGQAIDLAMQDVAAWSTQLLWDGRPEMFESRPVECTDGWILTERSEAAGPGEVASRATRAGRCARLNKRGIWSCPVRTVREVLDDPQTAARGLLQDARDEHGVVWQVMPTPIALTRTPLTVKAPEAELGADNDAILAELRPVVV